MPIPRLRGILSSMAETFEAIREFDANAGCSFTLRTPQGRDL